MSFALSAFTLLHVVFSLIGILAGLVVAYGLVTGKRFDRWTALFLVTTVATSVTGFLFPFHKLLPSHVLGIISLIALAVAIYARYSRRLTGAWRGTYVITAVLSLYLNMFVLIVQLFQKVPALKALAPTQSEPPFKIAQLSALVIFLVLGILGTKKFRGEQLSPA
jgi:hypothetical protein